MGPEYWDVQVNNWEIAIFWGNGETQESLTELFEEMFLHSFSIVSKFQLFHFHFSIISQKYFSSAVFRNFPKYFSFQFYTMSQAYFSFQFSENFQKHFVFAAFQSSTISQHISVFQFCMVPLFNEHSLKSYQLQLNYWSLGKFDHWLWGGTKHVYI